MFSGVLADRFGHKRIALAGLAASFARAALLGAAAPGYATLLVSRFLEGVGFIVFVVSAAPHDRRRRDAGRPRHSASAIWSAYMPTGGTLALLAAPLALAQLRLAQPVARARRLRRAVRRPLVRGAAAGAALRRQVGSMRLLAESLRARAAWRCASLLRLLRRPVDSIMIWLPTYAGR